MNNESSYMNVAFLGTFLYNYVLIIFVVCRWQDWRVSRNIEIDRFRTVDPRLVLGDLILVTFLVIVVVT